MMCWRLPRSPLAAITGAVSSLTPSLGSKAAIGRLVDSCDRLVRLDGEVCTDTEEGAEACVAFLNQIDRCAAILRAKAASRCYRAGFTVHYRAAVPDGGRHYRVEVLAASLAQHGAIWVNGAKFEFSSEVLQCGGVLKRQLFQLCNHLCDYSSSANDSSSPSSSSGAKSPVSARRADLCAQLTAFDMAWTSFEEAYIGQLMEIEKSARGLLVEAIHHEQCLRVMEEARRSSRTFSEDERADEQQMQRAHLSKEHSQQQVQLFRCLSRLNSVANVNRKGREDLGPEVFEAAAAAIRRGEAAPGSPNGVIIKEVAESFEAMRNYLRMVDPLIDQVAPRLSENVGLAARLAQLEEGWELGFNYLLHKPMRDAMLYLVIELKAIQSLDPQLTALCESCDVEWMMVLPKLVWLCFLQNPERYSEVLRSLLPQRFPECSNSSSGYRRDADLQALHARFRHVYSKMAKMAPVSGRKTWELLVRWVSFGTGGLGLRPCDLAADGALYEVVEFVKELEIWSMELQRHCPQDWNQCSSLLVRCLTGCQQKQPEGDFVI